MIIKCEINQGVAYLLNEDGRIYRVKTAWDRDVQIELVEQVSQNQMKMLAMPAMQRYMQWPES